MIFIDCLSLKSCLLSLKLARRDKNLGSVVNVQVLNPIKNSFHSRLLRKGMRLFAIEVSEAEFFAGHLRTKEGENVWTAAQNTLNHVAYKAARRTVNKSNILTALNEHWGRNTILLYLSKYFFRSAGYYGHHTIFKILIADVLSRDQGGKRHHLVLGLPLGFTPDLFEDIRGPLNLCTYSIKDWSIKKTRLSVLLLITFVSLKRFLKRTASIFQPKPEFGDVTKPALLLLQEDDLSLDRSYRGQPHWLFQEDEPPQFRTLIIDSSSQRFMEFDHNKLNEYSIYCVPKDAIYSYSGKHHVQNKIYGVLRALLNLSVFGSRASVDISFELALLFMKASLLTDLCISQNIKAFMTCENQYPDADAMNLVGSALNVHTFSYQYSNMSEVGPIMMTTADTMFTFSPLFHERWSHNDVQPKSFIDVGYLFDSSFSLVAERAKELRERLTNNGSHFIICYFDESVQENSDKYGNMSIDDQYQEISALAKMVIQDSSTAVIVKTQFQRNSPSVMFEGNKIIESAIDTGRWIELRHGKHRNTVFPAEAAMASDIVIGHAVGATAGLETALAGSRCILLNPYGMQGANIEIFKQADILYENMDSALSAISHYHQGRPERRDLGDWGSIIDRFDSFRDGQSAGRLSKLLENVLLVK